MTDEIITPENTKLIAEWMGINLIENKDSGLLSVPIGNGVFQEPTEYNPITNADQSREIEEKLLQVWGRIDIENTDGIFYISSAIYSCIYFSAEKLPLAIYKAALYEAKKCK